MNILQVSTADMLGGAEKVAWNLFRGYREQGHRSWLAVGEKRTDDADVLVIPNAARSNHWTRAWYDFADAIKPVARRSRVVRRVPTLLQMIGQPQRIANFLRGREHFEFAGTRHLLELPPERPDLVHCHNVHGHFDLRALPWLSQQIPVMLTLHDAWLLSGHCGHSLDCERWQTGCGQCPYLKIPPAVLRDATAFNWRRKQEIYAQCKLYVATPCRWLMEKVDKSILASAVVERRVIPNGIDLSVFRPGDRDEARRALEIPRDAKVLLFTTYRLRGNLWKDHETMRAAVTLASRRTVGSSLMFLVLGEHRRPERIGRAEIRYVPFESDPVVVARFYQTADLYLHAARADTFPNTVLEALACGTPVVATTVGGIPEQVRGLDPRVSRTEATGVLTPPGDAPALAAAIEQLLGQDDLRHQLGQNAIRDARQRFDLRRQVDQYLSWYDEILRTHKAPCRPDAVAQISTAARS